MFVAKVKDVMVKTSFKFLTSESLQVCATAFLERGMNGALVFNYQDELVGIITEKELLKGIVYGKQTISEILKPFADSLCEEDEIESIIQRKGEIFPVHNKEGEWTGYVSRVYLLEKYGELTLEKLSFFDAIFTSAPYGILSIDDKGYITSINPPAEGMAGTTKAKAVGRFLTEVVANAGLLDVLRTGIPRRDKYQVGKRKYISNRSPILRNGKVVGAVGMFQDISEIEFISQELESVKDILNELDIVLNSSYDGILITDETGRIIKANQAFLRILGLESCPENLIELKDICLDVSIITGLLKSKKMKTIIERNKLKNNLLLLTATPVRDEQMEIYRVVLNIRDITEIDNLRKQLEETKSQLSRLEYERNQNSRFVYQSVAMKQVLQTVEMVANVDTTVLILGESGVGKEEIAKLIHQYSNRRDKTMVKVNCGAIPESLLESELFGYEAGAFTGANKGGKMGLFESANGGVIFLDEIGEIPHSVQVKLLRVLQEKEITRVGGVKSRKINVRILAATNRDLKVLVEEGRFREDLYYRLNVVPIYIPPLRKRVEDIPLLISFFLRKFSSQYNIEKVFSAEAVQALTRYSWPGNVRELANVVERLLVTTIGPVIDLKDVNLIFETSNEKQNEQQDNIIYVNGILPLREAIREVEKQLLTKAFNLHKNTRKTAMALGVNQSTVVRKMQKIQKEGKECASNSLLHRLS